MAILDAIFWELPEKGDEIGSCMQSRFTNVQWSKPYNVLIFFWMISSQNELSK